MDWYQAELAKTYEIQTQKLGGATGQKAEGKILNRILRHTADGREIEAGPRHAEVVIEQLGLDNDSGAATPGLSGGDEEDRDTDVPLIVVPQEAPGASVEISHADRADGDHCPDRCRLGSLQKDKKEQIGRQHLHRRSLH